MRGRSNGGHVLEAYDLMDLLMRAHDIGATGLHVEAKGRTAIHYRYLTAIQDPLPGWRVWLPDTHVWVPVRYEYSMGDAEVSTQRLQIPAEFRR